jgi:hypothetical protein
VAEAPVSTFSADVDTGQTQAAEALMTTLHKRFPKENLAAKLKEMQKK